MCDEHQEFVFPLSSGNITIIAPKDMTPFDFNTLNEYIIAWKEVTHMRRSRDLNINIRPLNESDLKNM